MPHEVRSITNPVQTGEGRTIFGYAAIWDTPAKVGFEPYTFTELIRPGAFRDSLAKGEDVVSFFNHNPENMLGRVSNGTATFREDSIGLRFEVVVPDTSFGNDLLKLIQRGDVRGASFRFDVLPGGEKWSGETRELTAMKLYEAGPVVMPVYTETSVDVRSRVALATPNDTLRLRLQLATKPR
jgi:uncharacterized protein